MSAQQEVHRHEIFYFDDGSLILQAENTLYKVYQQQLCLKSTFFATMISLQTQGSQSTDSDGRSDERALKLLHGTPEELDALFGFIFNMNDWSIEVPEIDKLHAILKLSHFYDVESARRYAIHYLTGHIGLRPALRLHLACHYDVEDWVGTAFRELMETSILNINATDQELIGQVAYRMLVRTHAKVDLHRLRLAFAPPKTVHCTDCYD